MGGIHIILNETAHLTRLCKHPRQKITTGLEYSTKRTAEKNWNLNARACWKFCRLKLHCFQSCLSSQINVQSYNQNTRPAGKGPVFWLNLPTPSQLWATSQANNSSVMEDRVTINKDLTFILDNKTYHLVVACIWKSFE